MNFTELQAETAIRVGVATNDQAIGTLASLVKAALRRIDTVPPDGWNWQRVTATIPLIAGTEEYAFSSIASTALMETCRKIVEVKIAVPATGGGAFYPLKRVSRSEADNLYPDTASQVVQCFYTEGLSIGFRPVPDAAYSTRITFIRGEKELSGTITPWMPVEYHDAIVEKAAELFFRGRHNLPDAQVAASAYGEILKQMQAGQRPHTGAGRVHVEDLRW